MSEKLTRFFKTACHVHHISSHTQREQQSFTCLHHVIIFERKKDTLYLLLDLFGLRAIMQVPTIQYVSFYLQRGATKLQRTALQYKHSSAKKIIAQADCVLHFSNARCSKTVWTIYYYGT